MNEILFYIASAIFIAIGWFLFVHYTARFWYNGKNKEDTAMMNKVNRIISNLKEAVHGKTEKQ